MQHHLVLRLTLLLLACLSTSAAELQDVLPGTEPLSTTGDVSAQMVAGIDRFLMNEINRSVDQRAKLWHRSFASARMYEKSIAPNRERFRKYIGAVDPRVPQPKLELVSSPERPAKLAETERLSIYAVRWPVFDGVFGEGLILQPKTQPVASVVAIPDADQTPEMLAGLMPGIPAEAQFARKLAESGCVVIIPVLISREDTWSGNADLKRFTNQPHREWIYRPAFELGRHIIGYEVQKVLAAVDWFSQTNTLPNSDLRAPSGKIGVVGYAEGGLIAFYSAAIDTRIRATMVSGYFGSRQRIWEEPIYRNVFGLLTEFGDAEIASLIAPRSLVIEHSEVPQIKDSPAPREGRQGAAPGKLATPDYNGVEAEFNRASDIVRALHCDFEFEHGNEGITVGSGSVYALNLFLKFLDTESEVKPNTPAKADAPQEVAQQKEEPLLKLEGIAPDVQQRQKRQVEALQQFTQRLLLDSEQARETFFWKSLETATNSEWAAACKPFRDQLWDEVIGRFPKPTMPANPRTRKIVEKPAWTGYEVMLDVYPNVFAWGYLLVPNDLKPGERRPVVVCQHGLEGLPEDVVNEDPHGNGFAAYRGFAARLANRGFIVYAPHNPYRGGDKFRVLQRKANPLKKSLFSVIIAQHERTLEWLGGLPFVDPERIGFYGLSYGGKTAMRVPALLDGYCLSICSGDFNEWIKKNAGTDSNYSYLFTNEYEMPEFNLGNTFNYSEMAALIAPRPFMVERGHQDGVAPDEWVGYEFAKVRRCYGRLGLLDKTEIEFFDGPHTINGVGTFKFLHKHLNWPEPSPAKQPEPSGP